MLLDILEIDKSFSDPLTDPSSERAAFVKTILWLAADLWLKICRAARQLIDDLATAPLASRSGDT